MRRARFPLVIAALIAVASAGFAETMYARSSTEVRAARALSAAVVARLKQGDAVTVVERVRRHYKVSVGGKVGWIYYNKLAKQKPENVAALLAGGPTAGAIELTELQAGGALRGLSPMAEKYAEGANLPDWTLQAVEDMQSRKITDTELDDFSREGRLGEYGEGQ